jgi:hypothetical protein
MPNKKNKGQNNKVFGSANKVPFKLKCPRITTRE